MLAGDVEEEWHRCPDNCSFYAAVCFRRERKAALTKEFKQDWAVGSIKLQEGVAELCLYHVAVLQSALAITSAQYAFAKWLLEHIGSQRKQHSKLERHKASLHQKMQADVLQLLEWVPQLNLHRSSLCSDKDVQEMLEKTGMTADATGALYIVGCT
jgi:hypothetical protein